MTSSDLTDIKKDKLLYTPGPLTTSATVKKAMLRDLGSRDYEFISIVKDIRNQLLSLGNTSKGIYEAVIMQGSGTFGLESVIGSTIPPNGKLLVIINGAYGRRIETIAKRLGISTVTLEYEENQIPDIEQIDSVLANDSSITSVEVVHCETTTGIMNPIKEIGDVVSLYDCKYIVDAMSSFGAVPVDLEENKIDYLISSSNKCIEGVPGFSFVLAKTESLKETEYYSRSLSLDLYDQWTGLEKNGQFRYTPPIQVILAFQQALKELQEEGGVEGRAERYKANYNKLIEGMERLGFDEYLPRNLQGYIITSFLYPGHPNFDFEVFYKKLNDKDFVIYPGKLSKVDCFRIGNVGRLYPTDIENLLGSIEITLTEMDISLK